MPHHLSDSSFNQYEHDPVTAGDPPDEGAGVDEPRATAVAFVTTEHFTLQGARSQTISEATGRASIFLASVSGGLVALGLVATATHVSTAFYVFGLILLPTLAFVGFVTFRRTLQTGLEDRGYAQRIARLRGYYFDNASELSPYLLSVAAKQRLEVQGLPNGPLQGFLTIAGMTAVITTVLVGATAGLLAAVLSKHSLAASLVAGCVFAAGAMGTLMRYQRAAWILSEAQAETPDTTP
jgi:RsiW-degrading membrane proteinase PrsW (M82 family)